MRYKRWRLLFRAAVVIALGFGAFSIPSVASADPAADRYEQYRYALETIDLTYSQYVARQNDFRANGCSNGPAGCRKPSPYNAFDWTDDGCSGAQQIGPVSNFYRNLFNQPCRLHDFGYRNFGKGLTLYKNESMRLRIDNRLKQEMISLCNAKYPTDWRHYANWAACQNEANVVYTAVRHLTNWGTTGTPPSKPASAPSSSTPGGGSSTPAPPAPKTYSETTGSTSNTFTNYMNAGGSIGPMIGKQQTVQISCKLTGFVVQDGNPWWYRVASSPWNGAYYTPADNFYNNGQTSGSLRNTPFVDSAVPNC